MQMCQPKEIQNVFIFCKNKKPYGGKKALEICWGEILTHFWFLVLEILLLLLSLSVILNIYNIKTSKRIYQTVA